MPARFLDFFQRKLSWHYVTSLGESFFDTLAVELDTLIDAAKEGIKQRFLDKCKDDALPHIAENYNLEYPARFDATRARAYLDDGGGGPWTHWEDAGT